MEVWFFEAVEKSVFVGEVHEGEADWREEGDDGLDGHEKGSNKCSLDDIRILIAQLKLIEGKDPVKLGLPLQIQQSLLYIT